MHRAQTTASELEDQAGAVSRQQLLGAGWTPAQIRAQVVAGRWQLVLTGVYATFSGPLPTRTRLWAALLRAGEGAAAGPETTLWLAGAHDRPPERLDLVIPEKRRVRGTGLVVVRRRDLAALVHPVARPPRLRLEEAALDVCEAQRRPEAVVDVVLRVVQRRLTTADRLGERLARRRAHRWRGLIADLLIDVHAGVQTPLEYRWLHDVERAHALPASVLNRPDEGPRRQYRDAEFLPWGLVAELDGQEAHPRAERFRDRRRDNLVTVSGRRTLRYGWHEIVQDPCAVAGEVALVLRSLGWTGSPRRCGPACRLPE